jgi:outer membrane immunogenic protein
MTKSMKPFALAMIAAVAAAPFISSAATAADLTNNSYNEPPTFNDSGAPKAGWGGAYVGGDLGMSSRKLNPFSGDKGLVLGVHGGYNVDLDSGVVGGEIEASHLGNVEIGVPNGKIKEQGRVAAKAKAGVGFNQTLVYGTAGVALTSFGGKNGTDGPDGWKPGWMLGAGVEQKLTDNVSARFEYNYTQTNDVRTTTGGVSRRSDVKDQVLKAGVNYRF